MHLSLQKSRLIFCEDIVIKRILSNTRYDMDNSCMMKLAETAADMEFEPADIEIADSVTFVWEIIMIFGENSGMMETSKISNGEVL